MFDRRVGLQWPKFMFWSFTCFDVVDRVLLGTGMFLVRFEALGIFGPPIEHNLQRVGSAGYLPAALFRRRLVTVLCTPVHVPLSAGGLVL